MFSVVPVFKQIYITLKPENREFSLICLEVYMLKKANFLSSLLLHPADPTALLLLPHPQSASYLFRPGPSLLLLHHESNCPGYPLTPATLEGHFYHIYPEPRLPFDPCHPGGPVLLLRGRSPSTRGRGAITFRIPIEIMF